jgi:predicted enzyme related to lactoylglutathione lyase
MLLALHVFESPPVLPAERHAYNRAGFTQFAFGVDDIETAARHISKHGGTLLESSRVETHDAILIAFNDPDGTRLELVQ